MSLQQKINAIVIVSLLIITIILVALHDNYHTGAVPNREIRLSPWVPPYMDIFALLTILSVGFLVSIVVAHFNIPTPYSVFMILFGFMFGMLAYYVVSVYLMLHVVNLAPEVFLFIYTPVLIFHLTYSLDAYIFFKTLPQILVIGILVALVTSVIFGLLLKFVISSYWPIRFGIYFGLLCLPIGPAPVTSILRQQSTTRTKQISVLLEGEAVISVVIADVVHHLAMGAATAMTTVWYQYVLLFLRFIALGLLFGLIVGYLGTLLLRQMYTDKMSVYLITFSLPIITYTISEMYISGCGSVSVVVIGIIMSLERTSLNKNVEKFMLNFWDFIGFAMDVLVCTLCGMKTPIFITPLMHWNQYILVVVAYVTLYVIRFVCFLIFSPILSRLGYGMDLKNMTVCVWGGLRSPFSVMIVEFFRMKVYHIVPVYVSATFFFYIIGIYFLSLLLNASFMNVILDFLDLSKISMARQVNMNNCMKHIFTKRERTIAILKIDRFCADANWPLIMEVTTMRHPYQLGIKSDEEDAFFQGYRFTFCPDCKKEVIQEPTAKELREMAKEAKMRVLKAKKMSYSRQFENGMITKNGIRILHQAVELAMDSSDAEIQLEDLTKMFTDESWFYRFVRFKVSKVTTQITTTKPPQSYWRRVCYHIVNKLLYEKIMYVVAVLNVVVLILDMVYHPFLSKPNAKIPVNKDKKIYFFAVKILFFLLFLIEFVIKILAYSAVRIWPNAFKTYFKSIWNSFEFIVLLASLLDLINEFLDFFMNFENNQMAGFYRIIVDIFRLAFFLRLFYIIKILYPFVIKILDQEVDSRMTFTYELGKSYATGETEILDMLPYVIDNKKIRDEIASKIDTDRLTLTKLLGLVQKERPWVAITVKTKQAIRTILSSMNEAIKQLKTAGWVDNYEIQLFNEAMEELYKTVNKIKMVEPSPPKVIFKEVSWMANDQAVIDFLFENVTVKTFEPGDLVFGEGMVADGIYIVVTGLFVISYTPDPNILFSLREYGRLPIVDYMSGSKYEESATDYVVSGNCIGELSTLTGRAYNCTITADAHTVVYVLSHGVIKRAMELNPDPIIGLECRMWKDVSVRLALPLLIATPAYQALSQDQVKYALERAFVPDLSNFKIFAVTDMIQDIILIDGVVSDYNTRESFAAPCCIPRTVQKLILPNSSLINIPIDIETKLLIIPEKDVDEYDVMLLAEETCEMVATGSSSRCLIHTVRQRSRNRRRGRRGFNSAQSRVWDRRKRFTATSTDSDKTDVSSVTVDSNGSMVFKSNVGRESSYLMKVGEDDEAEEERRAQEFMQSQASKRRATISYFY